MALPVGRLLVLRGMTEVTFLLAWDSWGQFPTSGNSALDTRLLPIVIVTFVRSHLSHLTLSTNESFAILHSFLHPRVAVNLGLVSHQSPVLHDGPTNGTFPCAYDAHS